MDKLSFGDTLPGAAERDTSLDQMPVVDLADLLLLSVVRHKANALYLEPVATRHGVRYEHGGSMVTLASLDSAVADAVAARLAILANLDLAAKDEQVGRLRVRTSGAAGDSLFKPVVEVLVVVRVTSQGLVLELRRIVGPEDLFEFEATQPPGALSLGGSIGQVGPYRILGELGRGGMGIVYRAEHTVLQRPVAIKVLHAGSANDPEAAARFISEARAACRAHHPGIVDVYDFGRLPDRRAYLVMELVDGDSLEVLLQKGALAPERALDIALQMADALEAAAKSNVVHRDLKPANIFLNKDGRVKIGDFGVAKVIDSQSRGEGHTIVGTVYYMAPEQARGVPVDARSDLYSLGCMLYEMLTGKVPFDGETPAEVLQRQLSESPPPLSSELPESAERVVRRAMAKRPEERYQSATEMKAELSAALAALSRGGWRRWLPT
jgi:serine/threonine-protein kinase